MCYKVIKLELYWLLRLLSSVDYSFLLHLDIAISLA